MNPIILSNFALKEEYESKANINGDPTSQYAQLLPPFDTNTHRVSQVFAINKIVTSALATPLLAEAKLLSEADDETKQKWETKKIYPHFVISRLNYLPVDNLQAVGIATPGGKRKRKSNDGTERPVTRMEMATNLALLGHLFRLYRLRPRDLQSKTPLPHSPAAISKHLMSEFTVLMIKEGMERTKVRCVVLIWTLSCLISQSPVLIPSFNYAMNDLTHE